MTRTWATLWLALRFHEHPRPSVIDIAASTTPELDRLWLLDRLSEWRLPLGLLASPEMGLSLNAHPPPSGQSAIPAILAAAWRDRLVGFLVGEHDVVPLDVREVYRWFDEAASGRGTVGVRLTPLGGEAFERAFAVRWARFVDIASDPEAGVGWQGIGLERGAIEAELERVVAEVGPVDVVWDRVGSFRPAYWREPYAGAFRARVFGPPCRLMEVEPLAWRANRYLGQDERAWVDLRAIGWSETSVSVGCFGGRLDDATGSDGTAQLRMTSSDGEHGILELSGLGWSTVYALRCEGGRRRPVFLRGRMKAGMVELHFASFDDDGSLLSFAAQRLPGARATWWTTSSAGPDEADVRG